MAKNKISRFGPGFLVTAAFIGPGTVTTCTRAGSEFGYALIFALLFATITTIILQEMSGRLSLATGKDLAQSLRAYPKTTFTRVVFIAITLGAIIFGCAIYETGNIIGGSLGLETVTAIPHKIWVGIISLIAILMLGSGRYKHVEKFLIFLVFMMSASFLTTLILIKPDISSILKGFIPSLPPGSLYLTLGLIGTTVVPYNLFLHSAAVKEKWMGAAGLAVVRKDLVISIGLGGLISMAIVITSAAAFFSAGIKVSSGVQMAQQLKPLFGSLTNILFGLGLFAAGLSSTLTAPYAAAFASSGVMGWAEGKKSKGFRLTWFGVILVGFIVSLFDISPFSVIVFAQVANGLILPIAAIFLLLVMNDRKTMGNYRNTLKQNIVGGLITLVVTGLGLWNIIKIIIRLILQADIE